PPLLRECWNKLNRTFMKRVKTVGLTPDQYIALRWLHEFPMGQISQVKLAELMFTDSNNVAGLMKRMEQLNLIRRKSNATDLRKKNIFQTEFGSSLFYKGKKIADKLELEALSCLSANEKEHFLELLSQLSLQINEKKSINRS
ncbi:MAG: MarR family transcriptional regulator, partial [Opitutales bacterium]|nr:MarR family transcriptional regulator [Opitutales bacterium]